jgi:hypothetical protein
MAEVTVLRCLLVHWSEIGQKGNCEPSKVVLGAPLRREGVTGALEKGFALTP